MKIKRERIYILRKAKSFCTKSKRAFSRYKLRDLVMTRKIKFRGKDFLGRWHYGHLHLATGSSSLMIQVDSFDSFGVLPKTVGQFTGLFDKNGKEIYEGDIIFSQKCNSEAVLHQIEYNVDNAMFVAKLKGWDFDFCRISQDWIDEYGKEVIGNVFDNPELLEGGAE